MHLLPGTADPRAPRTTKGRHYPHHRLRHAVLLVVLVAVVFFVLPLHSDQLKPLPELAENENTSIENLSTATSVAPSTRVPTGTRAGAAAGEVYAYPPAARGPEGVIVPLMSVAARTDGGANFTPNVSLRDGDAVAPHQLPSWSLHVMAEECEGCTDRDAYAETLASAGLRTLPDPTKQAVFATTFAPLGLVGPMLLAMASVTDGVDAAAELPLWPWVRDGFVPAANAMAAVSLHLAVMATPSTDQTYRLLLREGQRQTWRTYSEVARRENNFVGALLPLYFFAAGELRAAEATSVYRASIRHVSLGEGSATNLSSLLPTVGEVKAAEACQEKDGAAAGCSVAQRRVQLRATWRSEALPESPCSHVTTVMQEVGPARGPSPLASISSQLSLPVLPAFTAPSRFICHASSALWLEALEHRDVLWLDMYTDVKPTTKKRFGSEGSQGEGVEIGMSQKTMLWLNYAYHHFPDTPYIIKGDDDMYVKVPQFLSNLRWLRGDRDRPAHVEALRALRSQNATSRHSSLFSGVKGECLYLGNTYQRKRNQLYQAGMFYLVDRRMVRGILERPRIYVKDIPRAKDRTVAHLNVMRLLTFPYSQQYNDLYRLGHFKQEDLATGNMIWEHRDRIYMLCPGNVMRYVKESAVTFYDLRYRNGRLRWSSVVLHRCFPPDLPYIHRYMQTENAVARQIEQTPSTFNEADAVAELVDWAAAHTDHSLPRYGEWVPASFQRNVSAACNSTYAEMDNTTIYHTWYRDARYKRKVKRWFQAVPFKAGLTC